MNLDPNCKNPRCPNRSVKADHWNPQSGARYCRSCATGYYFGPFGILIDAMTPTYEATRDLDCNHARFLALKAARQVAAAKYHGLNA